MCRAQSGNDTATGMTQLNVNKTEANASEVHALSPHPVLDEYYASASERGAAVDALFDSTATDCGDIAESLAMQRVFGEGIATSTLKGHIGHTLGACGAIEAWATLHMLADAWFAPTNNLTDPDPQCGKVDYIMNAGHTLAAGRVMSNNFAFGGANTSLLFAPA